MLFIKFLLNVLDTIFVLGFLLLYLFLHELRLLTIFQKFVLVLFIPVGVPTCVGVINTVIVCTQSWDSISDSEISPLLTLLEFCLNSVKWFGNWIIFSIEKIIIEWVVSSSILKVSGSKSAPYSLTFDRVVTCATVSGASRINGLETFVHTIKSSIFVFLKWVVAIILLGIKLWSWGRKRFLGFFTVLRLFTS